MMAIRRACAALAVLLACSSPLATGEPVVDAACLAADTLATEQPLELIQVKGNMHLKGELEAAHAQEPVPGEKDLVFFHIPYNFGHTIERVGCLGSNGSNTSYIWANGIALSNYMPLEFRNRFVSGMMQPGGELWGKMVPELNLVSDVTSCAYAFTPPKYWPEDLAEKYLGQGKTVTAMLRDPYERLVALFRGSSGDTYGGNYSQFWKNCDINGAVKQMFADFKKDKYHSGCTYVPQSEFFEGKYGVKLAIDNRFFPDSFNAVMTEHGYDKIHVAEVDIMHVSECPETWSADMTCETRALVQEWYADDFRLLCETFGYCDLSVNSCIKDVPGMCPSDTSQNRSNCEVAGSVKSASP